MINLLKLFFANVRYIKRKRREVIRYRVKRKIRYLVK